MDNNQTFKMLIDLMRKIHDLHLLFSQDWLGKVTSPYNLRSKQIRHIFKDNNELDESFIPYIDMYCDDLLEILSFNENYNTLLADFPIRSRIKEPNSRIPKLYHYNLNRNEDGKISLNKCLNDLLGFRVLVDDFEHNIKTEKRLKNALLDIKGIKVHNSSKGDYRATHIYFQNGNNKFFPWELQIWCEKDDQMNIVSHSKHKQAYTKWPRIYNEQKDE